MRRKGWGWLTLVVVGLVMKVEDRVINLYMFHEMRANKQNPGENKAQQVHKLLKATISNPQVNPQLLTCYQNA